MPDELGCVLQFAQAAHALSTCHPHAIRTPSARHPHASPPFRWLAGAPMPTRTFIAVELPNGARAALQAHIARLSRALPRLRFQPLDSLHLTLAFLGELDDEQLAAATQATVSAAPTASRFALTVAGLGIFGPPYAPRVLWCGVGGDVAALLRLQAALADRLEAAGFPREERPFAPHLTLARFKQPLDSAALQRLTGILATPSVAETPFAVESLSVMKSELLRPAARYTRLRACPLGAHPGPDAGC
jgi:RNA 2',3'-cyclic 3'-phosphodiesterase